MPRLEILDRRRGIPLDPEGVPAAPDLPPGQRPWIIPGQPKKSEPFVFPLTPQIPVERPVENPEEDEELIPA